MLQSVAFKLVKNITLRLLQIPTYLFCTNFSFDMSCVFPLISCISYVLSTVLSVLYYILRNIVCLFKKKKKN